MVVRNMNGHHAMNGNASDALTGTSLAQARSDASVSAIVAKLAVGVRPVDYQACLTERTHLRKPSPLKALVPLMSIPDVVFMAHGLPPASVFPYQSMTIQLTGGSELKIDSELMATAQEYMGAGGYLPLREWCRQHIQAVHSPPRADWSVALGAGITDMFDKLGAMLLRPGDFVVVERFSYPQALAALRPMGVTLLPADTDEMGLIPASFEDVCARARAETGKSPTALYIVPKGQNPTGSCLAPHRYAAIYERARAHGMLIFEDDPYYFLQFPANPNPLPAMDIGGARGVGDMEGIAPGVINPREENEKDRTDRADRADRAGRGDRADWADGAHGNGAGVRQLLPPGGAVVRDLAYGLAEDPATGAMNAVECRSGLEASYSDHEGSHSDQTPASAPPGGEALLGMAGLGPSFLAIDVDGRVLRMDSFSKILAPGLRVGWLSGPKPIIDKYELHAQISSQNGATLSMVIIFATLEKWGPAGFEQHLLRLQREYKRRRDAMLAAADKYLAGVADWHVPAAGMFLWVRLHVPDSNELWEKMKEYKTVVLPGINTTVTPGPCQYVRISYSFGDVPALEEGIRRLGCLVRDYQAGTA